MGQKDVIISGIIALEWKMFQNVKNMGGRASCQEDYATFKINRLSQAQSWSEPALESYLNDLQKADKAGRNLLSEKYARMMASTSPSEYERIAHLLPLLDHEALSLADKIVAIAMEWEEALVEKYPHIVKQGRPIRSSQDTPFVTSVETYLRGELLTYSKRTLELVYEDYLARKSENINGSEIILEHMIKQYGYRSLEQANKAMMGRT
jgi:hypothetical protein